MIWRLLKKLIKFLISSFFKLIFGVFFLIIIFCLFWNVAKKSTTPIPKQNGVLYLKLKGDLVDDVNTNFDKKKVAFGKVYKVLDKAIDDDRISGLCIKFDNFHGGISNIQDLLVCLKNFKAKGKFITCYADSYTTGTYLLSSVADEIILPRQGSFDFPGFCVSQNYLKDFWDKIGIRYEVFKMGEFKSAMEHNTANKMSPENRQQLKELLEGVNSFYTKTLSENREIPFDVVAENLKTIRFHSAEVLKNNKFISQVDFFDVNKYVKNLSIASGKKFSIIKWKNYWENIVETSKGGDKIVVVTLEGTIGRNHQINLKKVHKIFKQIKSNKNVKGVVLKINSPGGDSFESDLIHHEISEFAKEIPVVVYCSDYAASGGYYISVAADTIVSSPYCITGSIGVFSGMLNATKLRSKLGVVYEVEKTQPYADLGVPMRDITNEEKKLIDDYVKRVYRDFLDIVAKGRNKIYEEVEKIAQGRVWLGSVAKDLGLVDEVGSMDMAIDKLVQKVGIDNYDICFVVKEASLLNLLLNKDDYTSISLRQLILESIFGHSIFAEEVENGLSDLENSKRSCQIYAYCPLRMEI